MAMKVYEVEGGSPEWHAVRAGVITSSMFKIARAKVNCLDERQQKYVDAIMNGCSEPEARAAGGYKAAPTSETVARALRGERIGEPSDAALAYAFGLAIERISGQALQDDKFQTYAMRRGQELEPDARRAHEMLGIMVQRAGFVTTEDGVLGSSTDGLIGTTGASEYKCLVSPEGLRRILLDDDLSEFTEQLQGGLMVTEREWMHFGLYCPALAGIGRDFTIHVVKRDEPYIAQLRKDLYEFNELVNSFQKQIVAGASRNAVRAEEALACL